MITAIVIAMDMCHRTHRRPFETHVCGCAVRDEE